MSKVIIVGAKAATMAALAEQVKHSAEVVNEMAPTVDEYAVAIRSPFAKFPLPKENWQGEGKRKKPRKR